MSKFLDETAGIKLKPSRAKECGLGGMEAVGCAKSVEPSQTTAVRVLDSLSFLHVNSVVDNHLRRDASSEFCSGVGTTYDSDIDDMSVSLSFDNACLSE